MPLFIQGMIMAEAITLRKNKICLEDYDYKHDIANRLLMAQFTTLDVTVLEEILYSSLTISIRKLAKDLDLEDAALFSVLEKLSATGLFVFSGETITVDKEMRKYFETQIVKFQPDFKAGMEFLQSLLRKVPIHILPLWYSIPRTSNNIFDSLVEKYLLTPQIFQRYLMELPIHDSTLLGIIQTVYESPQLQVDAKKIMEQFDLSHAAFEESLMLLEFHFVCCLKYEKIGDTWKEVVTPFHEWREYALYLKATNTSSISEPNTVQRYRPNDFSFVEDMGLFLKLTQQQALDVEETSRNRYRLSSSALNTLFLKMQGWREQHSLFQEYANKMLEKALQLKLAGIENGQLMALDGTNEWLEMRSDSKALFLYRHPLNRLISPKVPGDLISDRSLRDAEKSLLRIIDTGWVYFEDFIKGVIVPLSEDSLVVLKKQGKTWKYTLPTYSEEELAFLHAVVFNWLFEAGITALGTHLDKECFCLTPFGQSLLGK